MHYFKINSNYSLILKKDNKILCVKENKIKQFIIDDNEIDSLIYILKNEFFEYQETTIFSKLYKENIIVDCNDSSEYRNTNSYLSVYTNGTVDVSKLKNKNVLVIGLGGIGCEIINHMIGYGVKNFSILDYDKVEITNFNRQYLYKYDDLGKNKIDTILERIKEKDKTINVNKYNFYVDSFETIQEIIIKDNIDIVICAADTPFLDLRILILKACINTKTACIFGGLSITKGQYGPAFIDLKNMKKYLKKLELLKDNVICCNTIKASFGPTNTIVSAYMAIDVLMILLNNKKYINSLNKIKTINFLTRDDYCETKF